MHQLGIFHTQRLPDTFHPAFISNISISAIACIKSSASSWQTACATTVTNAKSLERWDVLVPNHHLIFVSQGLWAEYVDELSHEAVLASNSA